MGNPRTNSGCLDNVRTWWKLYRMFPIRTANEEPQRATPEFGLTDCECRLSACIDKVKQGRTMFHTSAVALPPPSGRPLLATPRSDPWKPRRMHHAPMTQARSTTARACGSKPPSRQCWEAWVAESCCGHWESSHGQHRATCGCNVARARACASTPEHQCIPQAWSSTLRPGQHCLWRTPQAALRTTA